MPIRGENIGTAYVRIIGDGSGLDRSIRDAFDDAEPSVRDGARDHGRVYADEFDSQVRKNYKGNFGKTQKEMFDDLNDNLTKSLARLELSNRFFGGREWKKFRRRLGDEGGAAGDLLGKRLEEHFRDSANLENLAGSMSNLGPQLRRAQRDILIEMQDEANRMNKAFDRQRLDEQRTMLNEAYQMNRQFNLRQTQAERERMAEHRRMLDEAYRLNVEYTRREQAIQRLGRQQQAAIDEDRRRNLAKLRSDLSDYMDLLQRVERGERRTHTSRLDLQRDFLNLRNRAAAANIDLHDLHTNLNDIDNRLRRAHPTLLRFNRALDGTASRTGRIFGRGSRNNFLNAIGGMVEGATRLGLVVPRAVGGIISSLGNMSGAFRLARSSGNSFFSSLGTAATAGLTDFVGLLAAAPAVLGAFAIAAVVAVAALGPLASLLAALAGGLVALVGSAFFALSAALVPLAAAVVPVIAALGGVGLAVAYVQENNERLLKQFDPLINRFGRVRDAFGTEAFRDLGAQVRQLSGILGGLSPLARAIGRSFRLYISDTLADMDSPGFRHFISVLTEHLPAIIGPLGKSINNIFGGIGGVIEAMLPNIERFMGWLERITGEFSDWANSSTGQYEIWEFFDRAVESAKEWAELLGAVGSLLADLFNGGGRLTGDTIVDDITKKIQQFNDYLNENPGTIQRWFGDVQETLRNVGSFFEHLSQMIDDLDTPENREAVSTIFRALSDAASVAAWAIEQVHGEIQPIIDVSQAVLGFFEKLPGRISDAWHAVTGFLSKIGSSGFGSGLIISGFVGLGPKIVKAIGKINVGNIITGIGAAVSSIVEGFRDVSGRVLRRIGKTNVGGMIIGQAVAATSIVAAFAGMSARVLGKIGKINVGNVIIGQAVAATSIVVAFAGMAGKVLDRIGKINVSGIITGVGDAVQGILSAFSGLGGRILSQIGHIDLGSLMHGSIDPPGPLGPWSWASGGIADREMIRRIGEDGPEAVVPLNRPLSQVDPSVRMLSAFAQGLTTTGSTAVVGTGGKTINAPITVMTPTTDPYAVAVEVVDRLATVY